MKCDRQNFLSFWTVFCPFTSLTAQKIKIFKKWKKHLEISSFYNSVPNDHMLYCSWNMVCDECNYFSFWAIFCPFTSLRARKIKVKKKKKKMKKTPGDIILHKCTQNHDHLLYCSWDMACDRCNCYFSFWAICCPFYPPNSPKNQIF